MNQKDRMILNGLFRDHGDIFGASRTTLLSLISLKESIRQLENNKDTIHEQIMELTHAIRETEPKIISLIHLLEEFEENMKGVKGASLAKIKAEAIGILREQTIQFKRNVRDLCEHGIEQIVDGDFIIVHSASSVVTTILTRAKTVHKKRFKVLVLKQDIRQTRELLKALTKAKIDHCIVPEYSLNHYIDCASKLFIGAHSVAADKRVIAAIGTANVVSNCHLSNIPVYLFINSMKFAHQTVKAQKIHTKKVDKNHDSCEYCLETFSHDHFGMKYVDHIFTEKGELKLEKPGMKKSPIRG